MSRNRRGYMNSGIKGFEKLVDKGIKIAKERSIKEADVDKVVHKHRKITI